VVKVYEAIDIAAPPMAVWAQIADPQRMVDWHAKLLDVRRDSTGPVYLGERFETTYTKSRKKLKLAHADAEVLRCEPWTTLVFRHHFLEKGERRHVDETYELLPRAEGRETRVEQTVDFGGSGLPLWARALMWCITRTGEPRGEGILAPLKRICEGQPAAAAPVALAENGETPPRSGSPGRIPH
jgi:uncharacterized protein YndB with AHSA1/START domain